MLKPSETSGVLAAGGGFHVAELQDRFHFESGPKLFLQVSSIKLLPENISIFLHEIDRTDIRISMQMILAQQIVWATSLALSKTSILTLYSKVFTVSYFILAAKITAVVIFLW